MTDIWDSFLSSLRVDYSVIWEQPESSQARSHDDSPHASAVGRDARWGRGPALRRVRHMERVSRVRLGQPRSLTVSGCSFSCRRILLGSLYIVLVPASVNNVLSPTWKRELHCEKLCHLHFINLESWLVRHITNTMKGNFLGDCKKIQHLYFILDYRRPHW